MIELSIIEIILAFFGGTLLGALFFGGLWYTVNKLVGIKSAALLMAASSFLRLGLVLVVFYWLVTGIHWQALLVSLLGFIFARFIVIHLGSAQ